VLQQQHRVADLACDPLCLQFLLKTMRFGVVDGSEAAK
jgi:hypothetical protein